MDDRKLHIFGKLYKCACGKDANPNFIWADDSRLCNACIGDEIAEMIKEIERLTIAIDRAVQLIEETGWIDGSHHKQWTITQVAKILIGENYQEWIDNRPDWDEGIAP